MGMAKIKLVQQFGSHYIFIYKENTSVVSLGTHGLMGEYIFKTIKRLRSIGGIKM